MIAAVFKVMTLRLWRDKGALLMFFVLPPLVFFVFAAIFSGTTGGKLTLVVAFHDAVKSSDSQRLVSVLSQRDELTAYAPAPDTVGALSDLVSAGKADAGLALLAPLDDIEQAPITIINDPANGIAGSFLNGLVQQKFAEILPVVALRRELKNTQNLLGTFTEAQTSRVAAVEEKLKSAGPTPGPGLITKRELESGRAGMSILTYYAGAIAFMFLMFSASHGAALQTESEESGITERLTIGGANVTILTAGSLMFLVVQGLLQAAIIFAGAEVVYDLGLEENPVAFLLVIFVFALAAAALAMAVTGLCKTRQQALTVSSFVILIWSAVGGSMVPRFLMPQWLQDLGWLTPNTWAVEAYLRAVWRSAPMLDVVSALLPLVVASLICFVGTVILARRRLLMN